MQSTGWRGYRRFAGYTLATLVPVVWLGVVLERTLVDEVDRAALRDGAAEAMTISDASIEPFLSGDPLGDGLTQAERDDLARSHPASGMPWWSRSPDRLSAW